MLNYDDLLQQKIDELENGQPLETILQSLPDAARDLEPLIRLAAAVRVVPHPEPANTLVSQHRERVIKAAETATLPAPKPSARTAPNGSTKAGWQHSQPQPTLPKRQPAQTRWQRMGIFGGMAAAGVVGAAVVVFMVAVAAFGFFLSNRSMDSAVVENITGQVQVATNKDGSAWKNINAGYRLSRGDRLRTLGASYATLEFFEGTHTFVSPNSDVTLAELNGSSGRKIQARMVQNGGETWHKVTPLKGESSFFLVDTPSGTASVHGTSFAVQVSQSGKSQFSVNTGEVRVKNETSEVTLLAGQAALASASGEISDPTYQFNVSGSLITNGGVPGIWEVSGVQFQVTAETAITGDPQLTETVTVSGRILADGTRVADTISSAPSVEQVSQFTGTLESMDGDFWMIGGVPVQVSAGTQVDPDLAIGDPVRVTFNVVNLEIWAAIKIESLVEQPEEPEATPTPTSDPNAMPSYEFTPDELAVPGCNGSEFSATGAIKNTAGDAKDYAANVELGYLIDQGGEYVETVELLPDGWERIDAGKEAAFTVRVAMNEGWASAGEEEEVKIRVFIASAANRPDHLNGRLTVTITKGCGLTPTPTVETTTTVTPEVTPSATPVPAEVGLCTGTDPHPTGMKLAQRYGVPYEEIMRWFCEFHYGFGEIDLAYSLSQETGTAVEEIFAMRASGMGWGDIKKSFESPDTDNKKKEPKGGVLTATPSGGDSINVNPAGKDSKKPDKKKK